MSFSIRHADPARDSAACLSIYSPFVTDSPVSFETEAPTVEEFQQRIARLSQSHAFLVATDERGDVAGFAYAGTHRERAAYRWAAEVSVYLHADHRHQGIGKALYGKLFPLLAAQGRRILLAGITLPNDASMALHTAMGFEPIGIYRRIGFKAGAWRDVAWLQLELAPAEPDPREPGTPARLENL